MIIVMATLVVKPEKKGALVPLTLELILKTRDEEGCISYELLDSPEDECRKIFLERWESMETLDAHMKTEHFINFGKNTDGFFSEAMDIKVYEANEMK